MLDKIRFKKLWFVLLVLPLVFTPVSYQSNGSYYYFGLTVGPQLAFPVSHNVRLPHPLDMPGTTIPDWIEVGTIGWERNGESSFGWKLNQTPPQRLFVDWGRIAYWEAWMLAICVVVNRKRLLNKGGA